MQRSRVSLLKFLSVFAVGGTERHVVNLARELDRSQFDLHLACFQRRGALLQEIEDLSVPVSEHRITSLYHPQTLCQQLRFSALLKRKQVQVVHTYGLYPAAFAVPAARWARVPVVIASIRDTGTHLTPLQKRAQKWACRLATSVLVNAEAVRQWLITEGYDSKKIHVIRNGIALDRFEAKNNGSGMRQELRLPPDAPLVAMLSRLNGLKGGEYFVRAAALLAWRFPQARFLIVGDVGCGDSFYKAALERQVIRLGLGGRVLFTGFRLDIPRLLSEVSVSVLPSLSEGLSNVLLESMAAGVPVVASRVGGNPEVVQDGASGLLVPPSDAEALAGAIRTLLEDPELARRYGQAGKERIAQHFTLTRMVRETEEHYLQLLERSARVRAGVHQPAEKDERTGSKQGQPAREAQA